MLRLIAGIAKPKQVLCWIEKNYVTKAVNFFLKTTTAQKEGA
jgi:hypothetical protein